MGKKSENCRVTSEQAGRIDRVIQTMTGLSRSRVQALFDHGCVSCNDERCLNVAHRVVEGDQVELNYDPGQGYRPQKKEWTDRTFSIVYEDDAILVVNKASKVLSIPQDHGLDRNTLLERVTLYLRNQNRKNPVLVNRLDRGMSGLVVFAKTPKAAAHLQPQFLSHSIRRKYTLIVAGDDIDDEGEIESIVALGDNLDQYSTWDESEGELSKTHYKCIERLKGASLVLAYSGEGQRNHIRLHMAELGFPVLGDERYIRKITAGLRRKEVASLMEVYDHPGWKKVFMAMHGSSLAFEHPNGKQVSFEAPIPKAMSQFIKRFRNR